MRSSPRPGVHTPSPDDPFRELRRTVSDIADHYNDYHPPGVCMIRSCVQVNTLQAQASEAESRDALEVVMVDVTRHIGLLETNLACLRESAKSSIDLGDLETSSRCLTLIGIHLMCKVALETFLAR